MEKKFGKFAFFEGSIRPYEEAKIPIGTHAFNYGTACFEGIRFFWDDSTKKCVVLALRSHLQRLLYSCKILKIQLPYTLEDLIKITIALLQKEGWQENGYIRPIAYKKSELIGVKLTGVADEIAIFTTAFGSYYPNETNVKAMISSVKRIDDLAIPARAKITGAYVNSARAKDEALCAGFDEAIVLNSDGHVAEASAANLFLVRNSRLITPPVTANILEGITRNIVISLAEQELKMHVVEREVDCSELLIAGEVFITGTACNISAITSINGQAIGNGKIGPVTKQLRKLYFQLIKGRLPKYRYLLTTI